MDVGTNVGFPPGATGMFTQGELGFFALIFFFAVLVVLGIAANQGFFGPI